VRDSRAVSTPPVPRPAPLHSLPEGALVLVGGDRVVRVGAELAAAFGPGDRLVAVDGTGDLLHITAADAALVDRAVGAAAAAFSSLPAVSDDAITAFYAAFARRIDDDAAFASVLAANAADVADARRRGRSTTRLELTARMRADMAAGLRVWRDAPLRRDRPVETVHHDGWRVELRTAPLGVVAFVFEGRPNVFADAAGVLRSGNTVVFRIGSDALGTARALVEHALDPALVEAGLPAGSMGLVDAASRSSGWALFSDRRVGLAVARGSGPAVAQLGAVARQHGIPVSLHGTGGAWLVVADSADPSLVASQVRWSLDRKVCNTLNVCAVVRSRADDAVPVVLAALDEAAAARGASAKLHVHPSAVSAVPPARFAAQVPVARADGIVREPAAEVLDEALGLGHEWEWEDSPEMTLVLVDSVEEAVALFNTHSPRLAATLISGDPDEHDRFYAAVDAPFVGNGFTRWVDGQFALSRPELGLSNWEGGRLLARSGVLSGDSVHTIRARMVLDRFDVHR
jgi:glutamate-5-semialdehyde dehydrogenase